MTQDNGHQPQPDTPEIIEPFPTDEENAFFAAFLSSCSRSTLFIDLYALLGTDLFTLLNLFAGRTFKIPEYKTMSKYRDQVEAYLALGHSSPSQIADDMDVDERFVQRAEQVAEELDKFDIREKDFRDDELSRRAKEFMEHKNA